MTNGDLLAEVMELVRSEKDVADISDKALARLTLVTNIQLFKRFEEIVGRLHKLEEQVQGLCAYREEQTKEKERIVQKREIDNNELRSFKRGAYLAIALVALDIVLHLSGVV